MDFRRRWPLQIHRLGQGFGRRPVYNALDYAEPEPEARPTYNALDYAEPDTAAAAEASADTKDGVSGDGQKKKKDAKSQQSSGKTTADGAVTKTAAKKRKRDSEVNARAPSPFAGVAAADFVANLEATRAAVGGTHQRAREPAPLTEGAGAHPAQHVPAKTPKSSRESARATLPAVAASAAAAAANGKPRKRQKRDRTVTKATPSTAHAAAPVKKSAIPLPDAASRTTLSPAKRSYVPLPPPTTVSAFRVARAANQTKASNAILDSQAVVPETPPPRRVPGLRTVFQSPIPLPPSSQPEPHPTPSKHPKVELDLAQRIAIPHPFKRPYVPELARAQPAENRQTVQPLTGELLSKPWTQTAQQKSRTLNTIPALFRTGKTHTENHTLDSFVTLNARKDKVSKANPEAATLDVIHLMNQVKSAVDFTTELDYMKQYRKCQADDASTQSFPCLGQLSGCTPKREKVLHQAQQQENPNKDKISKASGGNISTLTKARLRIELAEYFLSLALRASVPVPLGPLEGAYRLYSPTYSERHYDRFGFGDRVLYISAISAFKAKNAYTASVCIPPGRKVYPILAFETLHHASFRTIKVRTAREGCEIELVFLGNGYLHMRVDVNLLLKGAPTEVGGDTSKKVSMNYLGVLDGAVDWVEKNEVDKDDENEGAEESEEDEAGEEGEKDEEGEEDDEDEEHEGRDEEEG